MGERLRCSFREKLLDIYDWLDYCPMPSWLLAAVGFCGVVAFYAKLPYDLILMGVATATILTGVCLLLIATYFVAVAFVDGVEGYCLDRMPKWRRRLGITPGSAVARSMRHTPIR